MTTTYFFEQAVHGPLKKVDGDRDRKSVVKYESDIKGNPSLGSSGNRFSSAKKSERSLSI